MDEKPTTTWRQKLLLVAFGLVLGLAALVLTEGLLTLLGLGDEQRFADPYVGFENATPLFTRVDRGDHRLYATHPAKERFFNPQEFPADKAAGTYRVFTLGGSTTAGRPYDDHVSFARWLERYLDAAEPERRHEVVNAGAVSYASYRVVQLMKELVRYDPDLFVVLTGHNEFLEERSYRDLRSQNAVLRFLGSRLARYRLPQLVRQAFAEDDAPGERLADDFATRLDVWTGLQAYERDDTLKQRILEHFAFNLEQMVRIADAHDVALVFVQPVSNLKDFSPFKSQHRDDLTPGDAARFETFLTEGRGLLQEGSARAAAQTLRQALEIDPLYAEAHFRLGRAELASGNYAAAREALVAAKELDVAPLRALERSVELIAETAARHDVALVDLPALLETENVRQRGHPILGQEFLLDHVHPDLAVHSRIAEEILKALAASGTIQLGPAGTAEHRAAIYDDVVGALDRTYYAERDRNLGKVLGWAGKLEEAEEPLRRAIEVLRDDADVHLNLGILLQKTERFDEAIGELTRAVELAPGLAEGHFNLGVVYGRLGRIDEGVVAFEQALRIRPDYGEARHNLDVLSRHDSAAARTDLAVSLATSGRLDEAAAELRRALELDPNYAEATYNLGLLYARTGRPAEAVIAYERTLKLDAGHAPTHNNLGILRAGQGHLETARRHLEQATQIDPTYAEAFLNLGVVYDSLGRGHDAIRTVERALALRPEDGRVHLALGMLYLAAGKDDALVHFEAARSSGLVIPAEIATRLGSAWVSRSRDTMDPR
jgi:tetratricopeptide (TPR) repeat protein